MAHYFKTALTSDDLQTLAYIKQMSIKSIKAPTATLHRIEQIARRGKVDPTKAADALDDIWQIASEGIVAPINYAADIHELAKERMEYLKYHQN